MDLSNPPFDTGKPASELSPNYRYWREQGRQWHGEYDKRKKVIPLYHLQEIMLAEHFSRCAPARVLEFGCGVGRHLRYLRQIPGIDVHGFDQSEAMASAIAGWAGQEWFDAHVRIGLPLAPLPWPDKHFDAVFTNEVLVHVRPEDLDVVLRELRRVAKWHILHLEPGPGIHVEPDCHDGCWNHDLLAAWERLGQECRRGPMGYSTHSPHWVVLAQDRPLPQWPEDSLALMRKMEADLSQGYEELKTTLRQDHEARENEMRIQQNALQERIQSAEAQQVSLEAEIASLKTQIAGLNDSLDESHARQIQLDETIHEREMRIMALQGRLEALEAELSEAEHESSRLRASIQTQDHVILDLETQQADLQEQLRHAQGKVEEARGKLAAGQNENAVLAQRVRELGAKYDILFRSDEARLGRRLTHNAVWRTLRRLKAGNPHRLAVRAIAEKAFLSRGREVWLLAANLDGEEGEPIALDLFEQSGQPWNRVADPHAPFGHTLCAESGRLQMDVEGKDPVLTFLRHPWSGKVEVSCGSRRQTFDLFSEHEGQWLKIWPARDPMKTVFSDDPQMVEEEPGARACTCSPDQFTPLEEQWLQTLRERDCPTLAMHVPRWLGVSSSTQCLFPNTYAYPYTAAIEPGDILEDDVKRQVRLLLEAGIRHVVFSGGDMFHLSMARQLRQADPRIRCDLVWHGSFLQFSEDAGWRLFVHWMEAARQGVIHSIGVVKKGMEDFLRSQGIRSRLLYNYVAQVPEAASEPLPGGPHLGLWISGYSYRKLPFAALSAAAMIPGATMHVSNVSHRGMEVIEQFGLGKGFISEGPVPFEELMRRMAHTHLTLYVTFSECCPMLPLESFSMGVPALIGPASHLFEDDEYLFKRLVVPFPDRADVIAQYARKALEEREAIVNRYMQYAPEYNQRARASVEEFLGD